MAWIDFAVCFFLGMLGVHKFRERKIGMGILYLFTGGLLGIGWLYDCVRYLIAAVTGKGRGSGKEFPPITVNGSEAYTGGPDLPKPPKGNLLKKALLWVLAGFFLLAALVYLPSFSGFLALAVAALAAPVPKWQAILTRYVKGKVKTIAIVVLAVLSLGMAPVSEMPEAAVPPETAVMVTEETTAATEETTVPTEAVTEPATEATQEPTTEPVIETTAEPTAEPTTEPAVAPMAEIATEPATEPETEPITEPTTEPTTAPTTEPPTEPMVAPTKDNGRDYVLNTNTGKFHYPSCSSADRIKASNRRDFHGTREEVIAKGYEPCGRCYP